MFMDFEADNLPLFWQTGIREIPPRPDNPRDYPETDARHWYDHEFAGWLVKKEVLPESPADGVKGKLVVGLLSDIHPYSRDFRKGMQRTAETHGINLRLIMSDGNPERRRSDVERAIAMDPDLIIIWIDSIDSGSRSIQTIYKAGIPIVAANTLPDEESFRKIIAWTGPDDWQQFRLLSRRFAQLMNYRGGYAVVCHIEGSSTYLARSWSVVTELKEIAPEMELLDMRSTGLDRETTYRQTKDWLSIYGTKLKGIVSADDNVTQLGINQALEEEGRRDIIRVANGSTATGMDLVKSGNLHAITYQMPEQDGSLPVKVAVDWFNGLKIDPIRHLPVRILDKDNISILTDRKRFVLDADADSLYQNVLDGHPEAIRAFYRELIDSFSRSTDISMEFFRGYTIEMFANLHYIMKKAKLDEPGIVGDYEGIFKMLFQQPTLEKSLRWLESVALAISSRLAVQRNRHSDLVGQLLEYVNVHYNEPLSLKTLSFKFKISAPYLGKLFTEETGESFTNWLNRLRVQEAIHLMKTTNLSVRDIAEKIGYVNTNYFYKIFKKYEGINPGEYQAGL